MVPRWGAVMPGGIFFLEVRTQFSHAEALIIAAIVANKALHPGMSPVPSPGATATCSCSHSGKWEQQELKQFRAGI